MRFKVFQRQLCHHELSSRNRPCGTEIGRLVVRLGEEGQVPSRITGPQQGSDVRNSQSVRVEVKLQRTGGCCRTCPRPAHGSSESYRSVLKGSLDMREHQLNVVQLDISF